MEESLLPAAKMQEALAARVKVVPLARAPHLIAAVDAAYLETTTFAAACLFHYTPLEPMEERIVTVAHVAPYHPGFFSLREAPAVLEALNSLSFAPDVILVDGHGVAHPRRCGLASHVGVLSGIPTIGCAKEPLCGSYAEPGEEKGDSAYVEHHGERIGAVVRTRTGVKPLFVSVGHLVTLEEAVEIVLHCCGVYRTPEPLRAADGACRRAKRAAESLLP